MIDRVSKRFGRAVPTDRINIVLLMDMSHKHASIEQFEPMNQPERLDSMDGMEDFEE